MAEARQQVLLSRTARQLVLDVQQDFVVSWANTAEQTATTTTTNTRQDRQTSVTQNAQETTQQESRRQKKRKLTERDDAEGSDSESGKGNDLPSETAALAIMCPFCWYDCETFSWRNTVQTKHRHCETVKIQTIARLK